VHRGSEEYWDSEKYQVRVWPIDHAYSLRGLITRVNQIRRDNPALQSNHSLRFHPADNDKLIAYSKAADDRSNVIVAIVNLDFRYKQSGWVELPLQDFGLDPGQPFQVEDLLTGARFEWRGPKNYVELDPHMPAHILKIR
jgi:starch synthase (maltosyl-transferring)